MEKEIEFNTKLIKKIKKNFDWFTQIKIWMFLQGFFFATSIYAFYLILSNETYRMYAIAYFIISETFTFICAKLVNSIYKQNNNKLDIKIKK